MPIITPMDFPRIDHTTIRGYDARRSAAEASYRNENHRRRSEHLEAMHTKEMSVFGSLPPLESSVACDAIHHYLITTCSFLNSFVADVNAANEGMDQKLTVLERQMALLESRLASVPGLLPEDINDNGIGGACDEKRKA
jgi:hypothetical protein